MSQFSKLVIRLSLFGMVFFIAACSRDYGFSRTAFNGKFVDKTIEQGEDTAGKAASIETPSPDTKILVYPRRLLIKKMAMPKTLPFGSASKRMRAVPSFIPR